MSDLVKSAPCASDLLKSMSCAGHARNSTKKQYQKAVLTPYLRNLLQDVCYLPTVYIDRVSGVLSAVNRAYYTALGEGVLQSVVMLE